MSVALLLGLWAIAAPGAAQLPAVGEPAPVFRLRDASGAMVRLDELAYPGQEKSWAKKRPLLVDFFRTDCRPCREALPELRTMHERYQAAGLEVLLIALLEQEDGRGKLERFLAEAKLPFRVVVDETEHFAVRYLGKEAKLPATFLLDRDGNILELRRSGGPITEFFEPKIKAMLSSSSRRKDP